MHLDLVLHILMRHNLPYLGLYPDFERIYNHINHFCGHLPIQHLNPKRRHRLNDVRHHLFRRYHQLELSPVFYQNLSLTYFYITYQKIL